MLKNFWQLYFWLFVFEIKIIQNFYKPSIHMYTQKQNTPGYFMVCYLKTVQVFKPARIK